MSENGIRQRILIVDDNSVTRAIIRDELIEQFQIEEAGSWPEVESVLAILGTFDLILVDQVMQNSDESFDGTDITRMILAKNNQAKVIIYTQRPDKENYKKAFEAGAIRYIVREQVRELAENFRESLSYFFALRDAAVIKDQVLRYMDDLGCGVSIIDKTYGLWYRNKEHERMMKGIEGAEGRGGLRYGGTCWVEYLCEFKQGKPCDDCPAKVTFETEQVYRTPVPLKVEADNVVKYLDMISTPIKDENEKVIGAIQTVIDVTDRENLIEMMSMIEARKLLYERIDLVLQTIHKLGYDRVRYYILSADKSEKKEMVLCRTVGHKSEDTPKEGLRLAVKEDRYWEHTFETWKTEGTQAFIYGDRKYNTLAKDLGKDRNSRELYKRGVRDWLEILLVAENEIIGSICVDRKYSRPYRPFGQSDIDRLKDHVVSAAKAVHNLRRYQLTAALALSSEALNRVDSEVAQSDDLASVMKRIIISCKEVTEASYGYVRLPFSDSLVVVCETSPQPLVEKILKEIPLVSPVDHRAAEVFRLMSPSIVHDAKADREYNRLLLRAKRTDLELENELTQWRSFGVFPIKQTVGSNERVVGILVLASPDRDFFRENQIRLVQMFCQKAAAVVLMYERKGLLEQIKRNEHMAALGRLVAGISHEITTPLTTVSRRVGQAKVELNRLAPFVNKAKLIRRHGDLFSEIKIDVDTSLDNVERITRIVDSLHEYSHPGTERFRKTNVHDIIDRCLTLLDNEIKHKVQVTREYSSRVGPISCLRQRLDQVFLNLLKNAVEASDRGGRITIKTKRRKEYVVIDIANTGKTIPEESKERIFEPFYTTKGVGEGMGLGLWIVHNIIDQHRGRISTFRRGNETIFSVELPIRRKTKINGGSHESHSAR